MPLTSRVFLFLKGVAMGAADVVPGVSGGTIAFITGIYEELLETLSKLNFRILKILKDQGVSTFWKTINGKFLLTLFLGIFTSLISLAKLVEYMMEKHPIFLWSFFFGLILASVWLMAKQVNWEKLSVLALILGTFIAYCITTVSPASGIDTWWYILLSGSVAITAMILPGISGAFILLLMGTYTTVLGALTGAFDSLTNAAWSELVLNGKIVILFMVGCLLGLVLFSSGLNWLFKNHKNLTIAVLTGFLIGSLNKIYPWKEVLETFVKHKGEATEELVPVITRNISPWEYADLGLGEHQLIGALMCMLLGVTLIVVMEQFSPELRRTKS